MSAMNARQWQIAMWVAERSRLLSRSREATITSSNIFGTSGTESKNNFPTQRAARFLRRVQEALPNDKRTALIEFAVGTETTWAFLVLPQGDVHDTVVCLPKASRANLRSWTFHHWFSAQSAWRKAESELLIWNKSEYEQSYASALRKWQDVISDTSVWLSENIFCYPDTTVKKSILDILVEARIERILIAPTQYLWFLPLHLTYLSETSVPRYLIDDYEVSLLPSASILLSPPREFAGRREMLTVVDPENNLPGTHVEAKRIRNILLDGPQLRFQQATTESVAESLKTTRYGHFACHTYVHEPSSHLGLGLADRLWTPQEIRLLNLTQTEGVTLSACESAFAEFRPGDEYFGLPSAFLEAGVKFVVASLWRVVDVSTPILMYEFYQLLLGGAGLSPAAALQQAQLRLRNMKAVEVAQALGLTLSDLESELGRDISAEDRPFMHPFYSGAFQAIGRAWERVVC